jgi:hypothetical protein
MVRVIPVCGDCGAVFGRVALVVRSDFGVGLGVSSVLRDAGGEISGASGGLRVAAGGVRTGALFMTVAMAGPASVREI